MFKCLSRLGVALKRASKRKEAMHASNDSTPEIQKDINWPHSVQSWPHSVQNWPESVQADEIRLPF